MPSRNLLALLAVALVLAVLAPAASAETGTLQIKEARYQGGAAHVGDLRALFMADTVGAGTLGAPSIDRSQATPFMDLQAARIRALQVTVHTLAGPDVGDLGQPVPDPTVDEQGPRETLLSHAKATLSTFQPGFQVHVLALDEPARYQARNDAGAFAPLDSIYIRAGAMQEEPTAAEDYLDQDDDAARFWGVHIDAPHVGHEEQSGRVEFTVHGDFVIESYGLSLHATDGDQDVTLFSGVEQTPVAGPVPLYRETSVLLRMFVEDATLRLSTSGGLPTIDWASTATETKPTGATTLQGATGNLQSPDGDILLQDEPYLLPAGNDLHFAPADQALALGVQPAAASVVARGLDGEMSAALVGAGAILCLLVAVSLGLLRRWLTPPTLHAVETALAEGRHRRAARLAGDILRRQPRDQDAALARAIALSKGGRPHAAITHARRHVGASDPADGSLHYVLGLALLDIGSEAEARVAFDEAVRRTPALRDDVQARTAASQPTAQRPAPATAPAAFPASSPHKEAHGYA